MQSQTYKTAQDLTNGNDDPNKTMIIWNKLGDYIKCPPSNDSVAVYPVIRGPLSSNDSSVFKKHEIGSNVSRGDKWLILAILIPFVTAWTAIVGGIPRTAMSSRSAIERPLLTQNDSFIYVYSVPPNLLLPNLSCTISSPHSVEVLFPKLVDSSRHHSLSPSTATYFLVPHYTTCMYHHCVSSLNLTPDECKSRASSYLAAILDHIQTIHPFWKRSGGTDHILVFSWDQASEILGSSSRVRDRVRNAVHVTLFGTTTPHPNFSPHKDIVIPPYANYTLPLLANHRIPSQRHILTHFHGEMHQNETCSLGTPQSHLDFAQRYPHISQVHTGVSVEHWPELFDAVFVLCPSRYPCLLDSLLAGSIPTIFADDIQLPFEDVVDYRKIALRLGKGDADLNALRLPLEAVSPETRQDMWDEGRKVRHRFVWNDPPKENDAFESTLQVLRRKRARPYFVRPGLDCSESVSCSTGAS